MAADRSDVTGAGDREAAHETRRGFIERARVAAAIPVIVALSMSWTHEAKAST